MQYGLEIGVRVEVGVPDEMLSLGSAVVPFCPFVFWGSRF